MLYRRETTVCFTPFKRLGSYASSSQRSKVAYTQMPCRSTLSAHDHISTQGRRTRKPHLGSKEAVFSHITVVCNLNKIVYLRTPAYIGRTEDCPVDRTVRTNLDIIFDHGITVLVDLDMFPCTGMCKTVTVTADDSTTVDDTAFPQLCTMVECHIGMKKCIGTYSDIVTQVAACQDRHIVTQCHILSKAYQCIDVTSLTRFRIFPFGLDLVGKEFGCQCQFEVGFIRDQSDGR